MTKRNRGDRGSVESRSNFLPYGAPYAILFLSLFIMMSQKTFLLITGIIFLAIFLLHGLRLVYQWDAIIGGWTIPFWFSYVAFVGSGLLSFFAFRIRS